MAAPTFAPDPRTDATRYSDRISADRAAAYAVLDEAVVAHLGFVRDGLPVVLPQLHVRVDDTLYLHGSSANGVLLAARPDGLAVCVTVTLLDGLVLARSAFHHSTNYRSVVVHGHATPVRDATVKADVLAHLVDHLVPGRSAGCRLPSAKELAQTGVLAVELDTASVKARSGGPVDDEADLTTGFWAGVLPLRTAAGPYQPAADLPADIPAPAPHPLQE